MYNVIIKHYSGQMVNGQFPVLVAVNATVSEFEMRKMQSCFYANISNKGLDYFEARKVNR